MQKFLLFFICLFVGLVAHSDLTTPPKSIEKGYSRFTNYISNPGFELGKTGWSSGVTITTGAGEYHDGVRGASWDPSGSGTISSPCWTTKQDTSTNALGNIWVKTADADYDFQIYNQTTATVIEERDIPSTSDLFVQVPINFVAAESTTYCLRLEAQGDESIIYLDSTYIGEAYNLSEASQASLYGTSFTSGTTSCSWSITQTTYAADFSADTDCPAPTVTGSVTAPATKVPQIVLTNHPPGKYKVSMTVGVLTSVAAENAACRLVDSSGTLLASTAVRQASGGQFSVSLIGVIEYSTSGSHDIKFQCLSGSGSVDTATNLVQRNMTWTVERFPLESQIAYTQDQANYGWTSYTPTFTGFGTATNIDFKHKRVGSDLHIKGRFTTGTVTAVEPRISLPGSLTSASSSVLPATLAPSGWVNPNSSSATFFGISVLIEPSTAYVVFGKQASTTGSATKVADTTTTFVNSTLYFVDAIIPIAGWVETNVPALLGSVITPYSGVMKIIAAAVETTCSSTPCTITRQSGSTTNGFSSITRASTGDYTANFASGTFSGTPWFCGVYMGGVATGTMSRLDNGEVIGANSFNFVTLNTSHAALDSQFYVMCVGPK